MNYFHQIEGAHAILRSRGVFKQVDLYVRDGRVFAQWGSGLIGLIAYQHGTTKPDVSWVELSIICDKDGMGNLCVSPR